MSVEVVLTLLVVIGVVGVVAVMAFFELTRTAHQLCDRDLAHRERTKKRSFVKGWTPIRPPAEPPCPNCGRQMHWVATID